MFDAAKAAGAPMETIVAAATARRRAVLFIRRVGRGGSGECRAWRVSP
jgi:hypothetical protein